MAAVQEKPTLSQREIAGKLDLSLGLVNKLIKDLTALDYMKIDNFEKNKVRYVITSKGVAWQADLKEQNLLHHLECYKETKKIVEQGLIQFMGLHENCRILFYGAGELCEIACTIIIQNNHREIEIVDDKKAGKHICGIKVCKEEEIDNMAYDAVVIMELDNNDFIHTKLVAKGIPLNKIFTVFNHDYNSNFF